MRVRQTLSLLEICGIKLGVRKSSALPLASRSSILRSNHLLSFELQFPDRPAQAG